MILADHEIIEQGDQLLSPFKPENVQPASVDLTLSNLFLVPSLTDSIDLSHVGRVSKKYARFKDDKEFTLHVGGFVLGSTVECVNMPADLVGRIEGKSSLGRLGLQVHSTAGFIDPGFCGTITLEFFNQNKVPITLRPGLRICQISFTRLSSKAKKPYGTIGLGSKYQGQLETTGSRYKG